MNRTGFSVKLIPQLIQLILENKKYLEYGKYFDEIDGNNII